MCIHSIFYLFSKKKMRKWKLKLDLLRRVSTECWLTSDRDFSPTGLLSFGQRVRRRS